MTWKVVCGMVGEHLSRGRCQCLDSSDFHGGRVPEDESVPKERRQGIRAKLNGLEHKVWEGNGTHLCREILNEADLYRYSYTEHAQ